MAITFKPLHPLLAAEAGGVDLSKPLNPGQVREIAGLEAEHYVLHSRFMLGDTAGALALCGAIRSDLSAESARPGQPMRRG